MQAFIRTPWINSKQQAPPPFFSYLSHLAPCLFSCGLPLHHLQWGCPFWPFDLVYCPLCPLLFSRPLLLLARAKARRLGLDSTSSFSFSTSSSLKPRIGAFRQELGRFLLARARGPERRLLHTSASPWNRPDPRHHQDRTCHPDYTEHMRVPAPPPSRTTPSPLCSSHPRHGHART